MKIHGLYFNSYTRKMLTSLNWDSFCFILIFCIFNGACSVGNKIAMMAVAIHLHSRFNERSGSRATVCYNAKED